MAKALIIAEHTQGALSSATAKTVAAAGELHPRCIDVAILAPAADGLAQQAVKIAGVTHVICLNHACHAQPIAQVQGRQIAALARNRGYTHIFCAATAYGKDLLPVVAALLGVNQISEVTAIKARHTFTRLIYAGNVMITVQAPSDEPVVATIRHIAWPSPAMSGQASYETVCDDQPLPTHTRVLKTAHKDATQRDLSTARCVIAGGRGIGSADGFEQLHQLAKTLDAAVGASRAAVDAGYAPNTVQIGQTGRAIAPDLYIAVAISGAIQHVCGIQDARTIVAINQDPHAPIFDIADIGLVGDWRDILPELDKRLRRIDT